jgi:hypothetical protein
MEDVRLVGNQCFRGGVLGRTVVGAAIFFGQTAARTLSLRDVICVTSSFERTVQIVAVAVGQRATTRTGLAP